MRSYCYFLLLTLLTGCLGSSEPCPTPLPATTVYPAGFTLVPSAANYFNNARYLCVGGGTWHDPFARLNIRAAGAGVGNVTAYSHGFAGQVAIYKDGAYHGLVQFSQMDTDETLPFTVDGPGLYTLIECGQNRSYEVGDVSYISIRRIDLPASCGASAVPVTRRHRLVIDHGDSVTNGGASANGARYAWPVQLESLLTDTDVLTIGYGGKQGYLDMATDASRAALLAEVAPLAAQYGQVDWIDQAGINDYAFGHHTPADWVATTRAGLTYLHANLPNLRKVYWASPTPITNAYPGPSGHLFAEFQVAVEPAIAAAASWLVFVDGNQLGVTSPASTGLAPGQLTDNAHPNDATYGRMARAYADLLR